MSTARTKRILVQRKWRQRDICLRGFLLGLLTFWAIRGLAVGLWMIIVGR